MKTKIRAGMKIYRFAKFEKFLQKMRLKDRERGIDFDKNNKVGFGRV